MKKGILFLVILFVFALMLTGNTVQHPWYFITYALTALSVVLS